MSHITVERSHSLGLALAREKAEALAERLASRYDVKCQWQGDTLQFKRSGVDGSIAVGDDRVCVDIKLGMLLAALGGTIKSEIERVLDKHLQA